MREDLCRNVTLRIFLSVANASKIQKQNENLFVLSVLVHMLTMKLVTYAEGLSYRWLETYGGVFSYRGLHKTGAMQKRLLSNLALFWAFPFILSTVLLYVKNIGSVWQHVFFWCEASNISCFKGHW